MPTECSHQIYLISVNVHEHKAGVWGIQGAAVSASCGARIDDDSVFVLLSLSVTNGLIAVFIAVSRPS